MFNTNNSHQPKVSIIITVYNGANYLEQSIECALNQDYKNIEVLVVNDGSNDGGQTEKIAKKYSSQIKYYYKENGGVSSALNYGIQRMTGEYFSWLSHDDGYESNKISCSVEMLEQHNALDGQTIAFLGGYFINLNGEKLHSFPELFIENIIYSGLEVVDIMAKKGTLNGCCMLIPKEIFENVGGFDEELRYSQDSLMWYKIFLSGSNLIYKNQQSVMYRLHAEQASQTKKELYNKDALSIAKQLAEAFLKADPSGTILFHYIKRLMGNGCKDAIKYLLDFAEDRKIFNAKKKCMLKVYSLIGSIRHKVALIYKKIIIKVLH